MSGMFERLIEDFEEQFASVGKPAQENNIKSDDQEDEANESGAVGAQGKQATMKDKSDAYLSGSKLVGG